MEHPGESSGAHCAESRVIAVVKEEPPLDFTGLVQRGPAATAHFVAFVSSHPRKLDPSTTHTFDLTEIHPARNRYERKPAARVRAKLNEGRSHQVNRFGIPQLHLDDPPIADQLHQAPRAILYSDHRVNAPYTQPVAGGGMAFAFEIKIGGCGGQFNPPAMRVLRARLGESLARRRNQTSAVIAYGECNSKRPGAGPPSATTATWGLGVTPRQVR